jgi:hypothetical protein
LEKERDSIIERELKLKDEVDKMTGAILAQEKGLREREAKLNAGAKDDDEERQKKADAITLARKRGERAAKLKTERDGKLKLWNLMEGINDVIQNILSALGQKFTDCIIFRF